MGHINVTDEWLYQHMPLVNEAMVNELEKQTDHDYQFSKRFENKMKKIIRKESHMGNKKWLKKVNVRTAAAMACIIIFLFTVTMSAYADKISFFETVRILWEDSFIYSYFTEETDRLNVKKPGYVPAGYEMLIEDANTAVASFIYQDDAGRQLICLQHHVSDGSEITFDSEYDLEDHIKITGGVIEMRWYSDGHVYCYLEYMENVFTLYADNLDNNDVKKIFTEWIHN